jgi:DNA polymerase
MLRAALRGEADVAPLPAPPRPAQAPAAARPEAQSRPVVDLAGLDWSQLAEQVAGCKACELHRTRTQAVFGVGDQQARLMIVGEAPGADEDRQGEPFVGPAGQLLNAMLVAIGLQREQVYITNILKCRPPGNRDPHLEEAAACRGFLDRQIELLQPGLILCLGAVSAHHLLATDLPVGKLRGRPHQLPSGAAVAVTYHPAYLLRRPEEKVKVWQDLQRVARLLQGERS